MRRAPNWNTPEDPVDGVWKEDLLRYLGELFEIPVLVETGTCEGSTILAVHASFKEIYSVELSPYYYNKSVKRLAGIDNITLYQGNSVKVLPEILQKVANKKILFWLDAHSSGGLTANEGDPLSSELKLIMSSKPDSLIVIDDMPGSELLHLGIDFTGWHKEYRTGEVIMHKGGYDIPPFED
jgi:hypothetical protein